MTHKYPAPKFDIGKIRAITENDTSGRVLRALSPETRVIAATVLGEVQQIRFWIDGGGYLSSASWVDLSDKLENAIFELLVDADVVAIEDEDCYWIPARHGSINWYPNNPFSTNASSFNYPFPSQSLQVKWDTPSGWLEETFLGLVGIQPGDALCYWSVYLQPQEEPPDYLFEGIGLPYYRFRFTSTEPGIIQFHNLGIPFGGFVSIQRVGEINFALSSTGVDPAEVLDPEGGLTDVVSTVIDEFSFPAGENEYIVYTAPWIVSEPPWLLFGSGLRGIRICTTGQLEIGYTEESMDAEIISVLQEIRDGLIPCTCSLLEAIAKLLQANGTSRIIDRFDLLDLLKNKTVAMKAEHGSLGESLQFAHLKDKTTITDTTALGNAAVCRAVKWFIRHHLLAIGDHYRANPVDSLYLSRELTFDTGVRMSVPTALNQRLIFYAITVWPTEADCRIFECKMYDYLLAHPAINSSTDGITNWRTAVQAGYTFLQPTDPTTEQIGIGECLLQLCLPTDNYLLFLEYLDAAYDTILSSSFADSDDCSCVMLPGGDDSYEFLTTGDGWSAENAATTYQTSLDHEYNGGWQKASTQVTDPLFISRTLDTPGGVERVQFTLRYYNQYATGRTITVRLLDQQGNLSRASSLLLSAYSGSQPRIFNVWFDQSDDTYSIEVIIDNGLNTMFVEHIGIYYT